ncbi:MarR family winged helix-turn-helix transcriptional regulator [Secundilactobacillus kimchicus]|uniref:MarR family winged helix-turn-helix transcriptional regulator n=1 Tax=Secundilactobacillus kimchicus TaxID=528209 RepID=UPI0030B87CC8
MVLNTKHLLDEYIDVYMTSLKYLDSFISEPAMAFKLSFEQYLIMHTIKESQNVTLVDIADSRKVTRSAISRQIKVLLGLEYIYQERDSNDRRRQYLRLTPRGDEIERVISKKAEQRFQSWVDYFGEGKAEEILRFIRQFVDVANLNNPADS